MKQTNLDLEAFSHSILKVFVFDTYSSSFGAIRSFHRFPILFFFNLENLGVKNRID